MQALRQLQPLGRPAAADLGQRLVRRARVAAPVGRAAALRAARSRLGGELLGAAPADALVAQPARSDACLLPRRAARCGDCRCRPPRRRLRAPAAQLIEWGGALRWCASDLPAAELRALAAAAGGTATALARRRGRRSAFIRCRPRCCEIHRRLKAQFRSAAHIQSRPPDRGSVGSDHGNQARRLDQGHAAGRHRRTISCAPACTAASAMPPAPPTSCSAMSWMVRAGASTRSSRCSRARRPPAAPSCIWIAA